MKLFPNVQQFSFSEWKLMRIAFSLFWLSTINGVVTYYANIPVPRGWALYIDLSFLDHPVGKTIVMLAAVLCVFFYIKETRMILVTAFMFLIGVCVFTYQDSQALDIYNEMLNLLVLGQLLAYISVEIKKRTSEPGGRMSFDEVKNLVIHNSKQGILACYLIGGIAKLLDAGLSWVSDAPNLSVAIYKMYMQNYVGSLRPGLESMALDNSLFIVEHPLLIQISFAILLFMQLFGIMAFISKRMSVAVGLFFIIFHVVTKVITGIAFDHFIILQLIFFVNIGFVINWVWVWAARSLGSRLTRGNSI